MNQDDIKLVKRLLKELGLYSIWIKNRKDYIMNNGGLKTFWELPTRFDRLINASFSWAETNEESLWSELCYSGHSGCEIKEIIKSERLIKMLNIVHKFTRGLR